MDWPQAVILAITAIRVMLSVISHKPKATIAGMWIGHAVYLWILWMGGFFS